MSDSAAYSDRQVLDLLSKEDGFTAQGSNASTIVRSIEADVIAVGVGEPEIPVMRILYSPGGNKVWSEVMNL